MGAVGRGPKRPDSLAVWRGRGYLYIRKFHEPTNGLHLSRALLRMQSKKAHVLTAAALLGKGSLPLFFLSLMIGPGGFSSLLGLFHLFSFHLCPLLLTVEFLFL